MPITARGRVILVRDKKVENHFTVNLCPTKIESNSKCNNKTFNNQTNKIEIDRLNETAIELPNSISNTLKCAAATGKKLLNIYQFVNGNDVAV